MTPNLLLKFDPNLDMLSAREFTLACPQMKHSRFQLTLSQVSFQLTHLTRIPNIPKLASCFEWPS